MNDIEQFLRDNTPEIPDEGQFMIETNARLNAVEGIKQTVDGEHCRWRTAVIVALLAGLVLGSAVTALIWLYPPQYSQVDSFLAKTVQTLEPWKEVVFGYIAFCAIALGLLFLPNRRRASSL